MELGVLIHQKKSRSCKYGLAMALPLLLLLPACSSTRNPDGTYPQDPKTIPFQDYDQNSQARGAAFLTDAMSVRRPMPSHSNWKPLEFYYKHCTQMVKDRVHFPKTSYDCAKPF